MRGRQISRRVDRVNTLVGADGSAACCLLDGENARSIGKVGVRFFFVENTQSFLPLEAPSSFLLFSLQMGDKNRADIVAERAL